MATVEQEFQKAFARHQSGDLPGAEILYRRLRHRAPQNADIPYLLGSLYLQQQDYANALPLLTEAVTRDSSQARYHNNLGVALKELGRRDEACAANERALALQPNSAEAMNNRGILAREQNAIEDAIGWFEKAIAADPSDAQAHNNLGLTLQERIVQNLPMDEFHDQDFAQLDRAEHCFREAIRSNPQFAAAHNNLGVALRLQSRYEEAIGHIERALECDPGSMEAQRNWGLLLYLLGFYDRAEAQLRQILANGDDSQETLCGLANCCRTQGRYPEALSYLNRFLAEETNAVEARFARGQILLQMGHMDEGWAGYEWRLKAPQSPQRAYTQPFWDGSALAGRTLLVHAEQGFGDTFQFIRYLPLIQKDGGRVVFECQPGTKELLQRSQGFDQIVERPAANRTEGGIKHDLQIPLMSLARLFLHPAEQMPGQAPYIHPDPERIELWRQRMADASAAAGASPSSLKVGLIWAGNPKHGNDRNRSMRLADLAPLAQVPGVTLFSLQKGPAEDQAQDAPPGMTLIALGNALTDFADTAGVLANLDVLISVDTSSAHLAGAMGIPIWLMLPFVPDWRWGCAGEQTPWYPSARLFRQPQLRDWANAVSRLTTELERLVVGGALRRIERADALFAAGQFSEAKAVLLPLADGETPHPRALNNLALLYWKEGATAETLRCFERALEIAPSDPTILANCSMIVKTLAEQRPDEQRAR
jgi:tetratricopeptide (TPR) repeat protein